MRWLVVLLVAALSTTPAGAATKKKAPAPAVAVYPHCATDVQRKADQAAVGHVTIALSHDAYAAELTALANRIGAGKVGCAVDLALADFKAKAARSSATGVAVVLAHAVVWRAANP